MTHATPTTCIAHYKDRPDEDYWRRRYSLAGRVLAVPVQLYPGEHLRDAILRATCINGLENTGLVLKLAQVSTHRSLGAFTYFQDPDEIRRLVDVLGLYDDAPLLRNFFKCSSDSGRAYASFFGHHVRRAHFATARRVSPRSLKRANYQRAIWSLRPFGFDPGNGELLLDACPVCKRVLGWTMTIGVNFCDKCRLRSVDLRDFPQPLVQPADEEALRLVADIVNPEVSDQSFSKWVIERLEFGSRGELFQLAIRIASECQRLSRQKGSHSIQPSFLEVAGRAILAWPASFCELVETTKDAGEKTSQDTWFNEKPLRRLAHDPTIASGIRKQILEVLASDRHMKVLGSRAAREGEVVEDRERARMDGRPCHPRTEVPRPFRAHQSGVDLDDAAHALPLERAVAVLRNIAAVRITSEQLSLPIFDVYEMYLAGLLPHLETALLAVGFPEPVERNGRRLSSRLKNVEASASEAPGFRLSSSRFALDIRLSGAWSLIFKAIFDGNLRVWYKGPTARGLVSDLYVEDLAQFDRLIQTGAQVQLIQNSTITHTELAMMMGKGRSTAATALTCLFPSQCASLDRLREIRRTWALGFELRALLEAKCASATETLMDLRNSGVPRIGSNRVYLWGRAEAMRHLGL